MNTPAATITAGQAFTTEGLALTAVTAGEYTDEGRIRISVTKTGGTAMFFRIFGADEMVTVA